MGIYFRSVYIGLRVNIKWGQRREKNAVSLDLEPSRKRFVFSSGSKGN
jgi:hypothetical protein